MVWASLLLGAALLVAVAASVPAFGHALPEQLTARPSLIDYNPAANASATVTSSDGWARFTVLTPCLLRMEYAAAPHAFEDHATIAFLNRALPVPAFTSDASGPTLRITTACVALSYVQGQPFSPASLTVTSTNASSAFARWAYGDASPGNLLGTIRGLDGQYNTSLNCTENAGVLDNGEPNHCEWGLVSRDGWTVYDDAPNYVLDASDWWVNNTSPPPSTCFGAQNNTDAAGSSRSAQWPDGAPAPNGAESCCSTCLATEDCVAWLLETGPGGRCWPLASVSGTRPAQQRILGYRNATEKTQRNADVADLYGFFHGHDYFAALADFVAASGRTIMVPRAASGVWWSRWFNINNQNVASIVDEYDSRRIPLDVFVIDSALTGARQGVWCCVRRALTPLPSPARPPHARPPFQWIGTLKTPGMATLLTSTYFLSPLTRWATSMRWACPWASTCTTPWALISGRRSFLR